MAAVYESECESLALFGTGFRDCDLIRHCSLSDNLIH